MNDQTLNTLADRLKQQRKHQQLTLEQLAQQSGVSRSMLSQIERGQANPTLAIACRIAQALNISIVELVEEPWTQPSIEVVKYDDPQAVYRADKNCTLRTLSPLDNEQAAEFYCLQLAPQGELKSTPHFKSTKEMLTVNQGEVMVIAGSDSQTLKAGDTAHYQADQNHRIVNIGDQEAILYLVVCLKPI